MAGIRTEYLPNENDQCHHYSVIWLGFEPVSYEIIKTLERKVLLQPLTGYLLNVYFTAACSYERVFERAQT